MPVCSQLKIVLLRTMWEPIFSRDQPIFERALDHFVVVGGAVLARVVVPDVVAGRAVLAEGDAGAFRVADHVVLDDPAFAPVGADEADLLGGGGGPLRRGVAMRKPRMVM